jgi:hypothetical protein
MAIDGRIDDLIEAGWGVLDADFDPVAFQRWRRGALDCLTAMLGPEHAYLRHFANFVRQGGKTDLLAAGGILSAAKEQASCNRLGPVKANGNVTSVPRTEKNRGLHKSEIHIND